jgi:hypothetical protein
VARPRPTFCLRTTFICGLCQKCGMPLPDGEAHLSDPDSTQLWLVGSCCCAACAQTQDRVELAAQ